MLVQEAQNRISARQPARRGARRLIIPGLILFVGLLSVFTVARVHGGPLQGLATDERLVGSAGDLSLSALRKPALIQGNLLALNTTPVSQAPQRPSIVTVLPRPSDSSQGIAAQLTPTDALPAENGVASIPVQPTTVVRTAAPRVRPLFTTYTVQEGDTLEIIARRTGIQPQYLKVNNPLITDADRLLVGQQLRIPMANGVIHDVHAGETLLDVAERYGSSLQALLAANEIADPNTISVRAQIFVPHAKLPEPPAQREAPAAAPPNRPVPLEYTATPIPHSGSSQAIAIATPKPSAAPAANNTRSNTGGGGGRLAWPASGPISSAFGPSHPLGIDIDLYNNSGAPIVAAAAGTVTFAGGDPCCSYGLYVDIEHENGLSTRYAHLSKITVSRGEKVKAGQVIGYAGCTGYCTGVHLHFEVRANGVVVNPMNYLR